MNRFVSDFHQCDFKYCFFTPISSLNNDKKVACPLLLKAPFPPKTRTNPLPLPLEVDFLVSSLYCKTCRLQCKQQLTDKAMGMKLFLLQINHNIYFIILSFKTLLDKMKLIAESYAATLPPFLYYIFRSYLYCVYLSSPLDLVFWGQELCSLGKTDI